MASSGMTGLGSLAEARFIGAKQRAGNRADLVLNGYKGDAESHLHPVR